MHIHDLLHHLLGTYACGMSGVCLAPEAASPVGQCSRTRYPEGRFSWWSS